NRAWAGKDHKGRPLMTATDDTNPWCVVLEKAIVSSGGTLSKPEFLATATDACYMRELGIPTFGFSPVTNTPILLHEHNEYLEETVYRTGIKMYESVIRALSSLEGGNHESTKKHQVYSIVHFLKHVRVCLLP
ncbi:hypothetical protein MKX03_000489, partial [Papaver bracteatum]